MFRQRNKEIFICLPFLSIAMVVSSLWIFFFFFFFSKLTFSKISFRNTIQVSNSLGQDIRSDILSGLISGPKLFAKVISRRQKSPLVGKELKVDPKCVVSKQICIDHIDKMTI